MQQLMLFPEDPMEKLEREIKQIRDQTERVRKSQFAKIGALTKMYQETKHDLETLKSAICRSDLSILNH